MKMLEEIRDHVRACRTAPTDTEERSRLGIVVYEDVPALLAEVERLEAENARLRTRNMGNGQTRNPTHWMPLPAPPGTEGDTAETRIEGVAFKDGDSFCIGNRQSPERCQASYTFVPECEHESADAMTNHEDRRATLILHEQRQS